MTIVVASVTPMARTNDRMQRRDGALVQKVKQECLRERHLTKIGELFADMESQEFFAVR